MTIPFKVTPIHNWHQRHGAQMAAVGEWQRVLNYGKLAAEQEAGKMSVAICDVTHIQKVNIQGKLSDELLTQTANSRVPKVGHCVSIATPNESKLALRLARLTDDRFLLLGEAEDCVELCSSMDAISNSIGCAHVEDFTSAFAAILMVGPKSSDLLKKLGSANIDALPVDGCLQTSIARVGSVLIRWNIKDLPGWMLLFSRDYGEYVWECILSAGHEFGIEPFGMQAQQAMAQKGAQ
jgi:sarcosine oxidase, subunit alpha